jgi:hypothetical protein
VSERQLPTPAGTRSRASWSGRASALLRGGPATARRAARRADRSPLAHSPHGWGGPAPTGPSADPREQLLARLREHVLADVLAGHSLDEVDDWLEGVEGPGREERAALWLYGWVSAEG